MYTPTLNRSSRTTSQSRTPSLLWTGRKPISTTIKLCVHSTSVLCSRMRVTRRDNRNLSYDLPALPPHVLKDIIEFATKKSHSIFDGHYYDQIDGVATGSLLGPVLANIFMCNFEGNWLMLILVPPFGTDV